MQKADSPVISIRAQRFLAGLLCTATALLCGVAAVGDCAASSAAGRPKVGLALSGGGARGAAHIGVLKVLEEQRVPVDFIAGTSMGALVGGLYASGMSASALERLIRDVDWAEAFTDRVPREDQSFRRKRDDDLYLVKNKPGLRGGKLLFPPGILDGQRIDMLLKRYALPVVGIRDFDRLPIPFRAVAADIATGNVVVLDHGDLALAMRASMSIPAVFAPREIDGVLLVDGGISNNLPIDVVRGMGADVIIAVDISTPLQGRDALNSVVAITRQLASLASEPDRLRQIGSLTDEDIFIQPDLGSITMASFDRAAEAIPVGYEAAMASLSALRRLSLPVDAYREHVAARAQPPGPPVIDALKIVNHSRLADDVIATRLELGTGRPLDVPRFEKALDQIYGLELFESVYYDVLHEEDRNVLTVTARDRSWGPDYLQGGVAIFDDFEGPDFNVALAYSRTEINRRNGEWRTGFQAGREPGVFTELHQPLDRGLRTFAYVQMSAGEQPMSVMDREGHRRAELTLTRFGGELAAGREMGTWSELRAGVVRAAGEIRVQVGDPAPDRKYDTGEGYVQFHVDRLDQVAFPHTGESLRIRVSAGLEALGSEAVYEQAIVEGLHASTAGNLTLVLGGMVATTRDGDAPIQSLFRLGGFNQLSGLEQDELSGQHAGLATATVLFRIGNFDLFPCYAGFSAEYGNVFQTLDDARIDNGIAAGSVFLGMDTVAGPIHLAHARAEGGRSNFYLTLGQTLYRRPPFPGSR